MVKKNEPESFASAVGTPPASAELASAQARIAELEAQLAARDEPARSLPPPSPALSYWRVELEHAPTMVVAATDAANAWDAYRKRLGVITSEFQPRSQPASYDDYLAQEKEAAVFLNPRTAPYWRYQELIALGVWVKDANGDVVAK